MRDFSRVLIDWYTGSRRDLPWRRTRDPYRIWVSEVMLQQTRVITVIPYFLKFVGRFPGIEDLARADPGVVLKMWEGLGYYSRARNLHKAAQVLVHDFGGTVPDHFSDFIRLPGVGPYIGAAVQSIAFGRPLAVVDGNVKRILARIHRLDEPTNASGAAHRHFQTLADGHLDRNDPGTFNQAMMELGALICSPTKPDCGICPVSRWCRAFLTKETDRFPRRLEKKTTPLVHIAAGVIRKNGKILITRRKPEGLLGGLWEFPGGKRKQNENPPETCVREILEETGLTVTIESHLTTVRHAYTHFRILMDVFCCRYIKGRVRLRGPDAHRWVRLRDLNRFAFPRANLKFIPLIREDDWRPGLPLDSDRPARDIDTVQNETSTP